jgi:hypothetical protein
MSATKKKLRVATVDSEHAKEIACSVVESAVGIPVQAEFQEIEGGNLILELQLGNECVDTPDASRLATAVDRFASDVEVLSAWKESTRPEPAPRHCPDVLGVGGGDEPLPPAAQRAQHDELATASWDRSDARWHLAVPSVRSGKAIVGMSQRRGYSYRFTLNDAAALLCGLKSRTSTDGP